MLNKYSRLINSFRFKIQSNRTALWILGLAVMISLLGLVIQIFPAQASNKSTAGILAAASLPPTSAVTPTPGIPPDFESNRDQTTGIVVGSIFLVLIIVVGTLLSERALRDRNISSS